MVSIICCLAEVKPWSHLYTAPATASSQGTPLLSLHCFTTSFMPHCWSSSQTKSLSSHFKICVQSLSCVRHHQTVELLQSSLEVFVRAGQRHRICHWTPPEFKSRACLVLTMDEALQIPLVQRSLSSVSIWGSVNDAPHNLLSRICCMCSGRSKYFPASISGFVFTAQAFIYFSNSGHMFSFVSLFSFDLHYYLLNLQPVYVGHQPQNLSRDPIL